MKLLIFGSTGLLGSHLTVFLKKKKKIVESIGRSDHCNYFASFNNVKQISHAIEKSKADVIINLIAMTNVDECESSPDKSYNVHVNIPKMIAQAINLTKNYKPHVIHISTDQIYSGKGPHSESSPKPINTYSKTKLEGERVYNGINSTIIRTNFIGKSSIENKLSFTDWLYEKLINKKNITVFSDVFFNPLSMDSLCSVINDVIDNKIFGTYNAGSGGSISKADFAFLFAKTIGVSSSHARIGTMSDIQLVAKRPSDMTMDCKNIEYKLGKKLPDILSEIKYVSKEYV